MMPKVLKGMIPILETQFKYEGLVIELIYRFKRRTFRIGLGIRQYSSPCPQA